MCALCTCRRQWQAHDGTVHADKQTIIELSSCMLRIQAAFTIEMGVVRGVGLRRPVLLILMVYMV
jgi:hypothetical protein